MSHWDEKKAKTLNTPAITDLESSPMEDVNSARDEWSKANNEFIEKFPNCVKELRLAWGAFESRATLFDTFMDTQFSTGDSNQPTLFTFRKGLVGTNSPTNVQDAYDSMPWANFAEVLKDQVSIMKGKMDTLPTAEEIARLPSYGEDVKNDIYERGIKANHHDAGQFLSMGNGRGNATSGFFPSPAYGCPAWELCASPFYSGYPETFSPSNSSGWLPTAWHPQYWFEETLKVGLSWQSHTPTAGAATKYYKGDLGVGANSPMHALMDTATLANAGFWDNNNWNAAKDRSSVPAEEAHFTTLYVDVTIDVVDEATSQNQSAGGTKTNIGNMLAYKPEWILQWNGSNSWANIVLFDYNASSIDDVRAAATTFTQAIATGTEKTRSRMSPGVSAHCTSKTLIGKTFFAGTLRTPEIMWWWNTNYDFNEVQKARSYARYACPIATSYQSGGSSDTHGSWRFKELKAQFVTNRHNQINAQAGTQNRPPNAIAIRQNMNGPLSQTKASKGRAFQAPYEFHSGNDPGAGDLIGPDAWSALQKAYFELKTAMAELREKSACLAQADVKRYVTSQDSQETLAYYTDPARATAEVATLAQKYLDAIKEAEARGIVATASDYAKNLIFREQCFLLANVLSLAEHKRSLDEGGTSTAAGASGAAYKRIPNTPAPGPRATGWPGQNASIMIDGDPYGYYNRLTGNANDHYLFNAENWEISSLQPQISLYKVVQGQDAADEAVSQETKIAFDSFANKNSYTDMLTNKKRRGFGVGIKSFNFSYEGSNPFSAKKSIKAKLVIFANSFDELLVERGSGDKKYRYVDLALKTKTSTVGASAQCDSYELKQQNQDSGLAKLNFRLKAVVGWAFPAPYPKHMSAGVKKALYDSFVTLNLTPTVHDFQFDEQGRVTMEINYLAYVDDYFDQKLFNIFGGHPVSMYQWLRQATFKFHKGECDSYEIEQLSKESEKYINEEKRKGISKLINDMLDQDLVYYINMSYDDIRNFMSEGPFSEYVKNVQPLTTSEREAETSAAVESALEAYTTKQPSEALNQDSIRAALTVNNPNKADVPYFYLGDLVDVILSNMSQHLHDFLLHVNRISPLYGADGRVATDDSTMGKWREAGTFHRSNALIPLHSSGTLWNRWHVSFCEWNSFRDQLLKAAQEFARLRVILGPLEVIGRGNMLQTKNINLGDLPVSVKYFIEFLTDKLTKKEEAIYSLGNFMNDLMNSLVRNFMNDDTCFSANVKQKISVNQSVISSYRNVENNPNAQDEIIELLEGKKARADISELEAAAKDQKRGSILNISGRSGQHDGGNMGMPAQINYLSYFAGRIKPTDKMTGNRAADEAAGIMHYVLGKDKGIVKNITLSKTQTPGLQEVRFEQEGYDGLQQLRVVYDVEIDSYAAVKTFPGTYIFVNPQSFAPTTNLVPCHPLNLTQYGIGGYYMIIRSEHSFAPGVADTKISAKWVNEVDEGASNQGGGDEGLCAAAAGGVFNAKKCRS